MGAATSLLSTAPLHKTLLPNLRDEDDETNWARHYLQASPVTEELEDDNASRAQPVSQAAPTAGLPESMERAPSGFMSFFGQFASGPGHINGRTGRVRFETPKGRMKRTDMLEAAWKEWQAMTPQKREEWSGLASGRGVMTPGELAQNEAYSNWRNRMSGVAAPNGQPEVAGGPGAGVVGATGVQGARSLNSYLQARPSNDVMSGAAGNQPSAATSAEVGPPKDGGLYSYLRPAGAGGLREREYLTDGKPRGQGSGFYDPEVADGIRQYRAEKANGGDPLFHYTKAPVGNSGYDRTYVHGHGWMDPASAQMLLAQKQNWQEKMNATPALDELKATVAKMERPQSPAADFNAPTSQTPADFERRVTQMQPDGTGKRILLAPSDAAITGRQPLGLAPLTPVSRTSAKPAGPLNAEHGKALTQFQEQFKPGEALTALKAWKPETRESPRVQAQMAANRAGYDRQISEMKAQGTLPPATPSQAFDRAQAALNDATKSYNQVAQGVNQDRAETVAMLDRHLNSPTGWLPQNQPIKKHRDSIASRPEHRVFPEPKPTTAAVTSSDSLANVDTVFRRRPALTVFDRKS